jgi:hypothetical protein
MADWLDNVPVWILATIATLGTILVFLLIPIAFGS